MNALDPPPAAFQHPVTVANCDAEPIHVPGAIQPHGVLLALEGPGLVIKRASANTNELFGVPPARIFAAPIEELLDGQTARSIRANENARSWKRLNPMPARIDGRRFDAVVHRVGPTLVLELEPNDLVSQGDFRDYAADSHEAMLELHASETVADLIATAVEQIRRVTGYDRVMVYRFDADDHGEVIAEARLPGLEPFLGLHYPASDIPAQARRLYLLNWLRIICDVNYRPAPLLAEPGSAVTEPLDMSFSILRSVSPIHVEYLRNMGVAASMSISLVIGGKLWGLIACHHYTPRFVPYNVRMTCELLGQTLSTLLSTKLAAEAALARSELTRQRVALTERLTREPYFLSALTGAPADFLGFMDASGIAMLERRRWTSAGDAPSEAQVRALAAWMAARGEEIFVSNGVRIDHPTCPDLGPAAAGVLAIGFPAAEENILAWFRPEQSHTVSWAGHPEKVYTEGPNGPRLSPRGSFALWQETVRDRSVAFAPLAREVAAELRSALVELTARRSMEAERARDMLLGMVSHDLRNPLSAISLAANVLGGDDQHPEDVTRISARIAASSDRMRGMIDQLLEFTRTRSGTLDIQPVEIDLVTLCRQLLEEIELAHPGIRIGASLPEVCMITCDPGRTAQAISNLLGNARHHGDPTRPITLSLRVTDGGADVEVHNFGTPIPPDRLSVIFDPFRKAATGQRRSDRDGLGLGLYIVRAVLRAHGGDVLVSSSEAEGTRFTLRLPRRPPEPSTT